MNERPQQQRLQLSTKNILYVNDILAPISLSRRLALIIDNTVLIKHKYKQTNKPPLYVTFTFLSGHN